MINPCLECRSVRPVGAGDDVLWHGRGCSFGRVQTANHVARVGAGLVVAGDAAPSSSRRRRWDRLCIFCGRRRHGLLSQCAAKPDRFLRAGLAGLALSVPVRDAWKRPRPQIETGKRRRRRSRAAA